VPPVSGLDEGAGSCGSFGVMGTGLRPARDAAFRAGDLRLGDLRDPVFRAGRDFLATFLRVALRADAFRFEALPAAFFRRGAFRLDFFFATVSPPPQRMFGSRTQYITRGILCQDGELSCKIQPR
jgi:hypothetical protein